MELVYPDDGPSIEGVNIPTEVYWVFELPTPLAGMKYPRPDLPWSSLYAVSFRYIVSLHPGAYNPDPLELCFQDHLEDLFHGGLPADPDAERAKIQRAVNAVTTAWQSGCGVVVHCLGGRGRTGTVIGCVLRELEFQPAEVIAFLDRVHKARGKPGWPESEWQRQLVEHWKADA